jgi:hypothetical protein
MVVAILWRRRDGLVALVALMAWLSAYEILFQATGTAMHGWSPAYFVWMSAAVGGWIVLAVIRGIVPDRWLLLAVGLVWVAWILVGFGPNSPALAGTTGLPKDFSVTDEILNELSKTLLAAAFLAGALRSPARSAR